MPFTAQLDGKRIISLLCSNEVWDEAKAASKGGPNRLKMVCCGASGVAKHSPKGTRYFAHKAERADKCRWQPESKEHLKLKDVVMQTITKLEGWTAFIEEREEEGKWRTDILAVRKQLRIAVEIQLSSQSKRITAKRNEKFLSSGVVPFWLKGMKNHNNAFGEGLQENIWGDTLCENIVSVKKSVISFIKKIENHVTIVRGVASAIKNFPDWNYTIHSFGSLPVYFLLTKNDETQIILISELGINSVPVIIRPKKYGGVYDFSKDFAGSIIEFNTHGKSIEGYDSKAIRLEENNISDSILQNLYPILEGRVKWFNKNHKELVPCSFVSYKEKCNYCDSQFDRVTHIIIGNPYWIRNKGRVFEENYISDSKWDGARVLEWDEISNELNEPRYYCCDEYMECPECGSKSPLPLISLEDAKEWPFIEPHSFKWIECNDKSGWDSPVLWEHQNKGDIDKWSQMIEKRFIARSRKEREEVLRQKKANEEREIKKKKLQAQLEEKRLEEKVKEEERLKKEKEEERLKKGKEEQEKKNKEIEAANKRYYSLLEYSKNKFTNEAYRNLWLNSANPKTGGKKPVDYAKIGKKELSEATAALPKKQR